LNLAFLDGTQNNRYDIWFQNILSCSVPEWLLTNGGLMNCVVLYSLHKSDMRCFEKEIKRFEIGRKNNSLFFLKFYLKS